MPITMRSFAPNTLALNEGWARDPSPTAAVVPRNFLRLIPSFSMSDLPQDWMGRLYCDRTANVQPSKRGVVVHHYQTWLTRGCDLDRMWTHFRASGRTAGTSRS